MLDSAFTAGELTAGRHVEHHFAQRTARLHFIAFQLIEGVERFFCGFHRLAHLPVSVAAFHVQLGQEADRFHGAGIVKGIDGFLNHLFVLAFIELALFATANQQDAFGENVRHMVQQ
ncbi:hypothetical protein D3C71_1453900 [compost metagenome]